MSFFSVPFEYSEASFDRDVIGLDGKGFVWSKQDVVAGCGVVSGGIGGGRSNSIDLDDDEDVMATMDQNIIEEKWKAFEIGTFDLHVTFFNILANDYHNLAIDVDLLSDEEEEEDEEEFYDDDSERYSDNDSDSGHKNDRNLPLYVFSQLMILLQDFLKLINEILMHSFSSSHSADDVALEINSCKLAEDARRNNLTITFGDCCEGIIPPLCQQVLLELSSGGDIGSVVKKVFGKWTKLIGRFVQSRGDQIRVIEILVVKRL